MPNFRYGILDQLNLENIQNRRTSIGYYAGTTCWLRGQITWPHSAIHIFLPKLTPLRLMRLNHLLQSELYNVIREMFIFVAWVCICARVFVSVFCLRAFTCERGACQSVPSSHCVSVSVRLCVWMAQRRFEQFLFHYPRGTRRHIRKYTLKSPCFF